MYSTNTKNEKVTQSQQHTTDMARVIERTWPDDAERKYVQSMLDRVTRVTARFMVAHKETIMESAESLAYDDGEFLTNLMTDLLEPDPFTSKESKLYLLGAQRFRHLIKEAGGTYSQAEVSKLLDISESGVRKRMERGKLLGIMAGGRCRFPVWQFDTGRGEVYPMIVEVLNLLDTDSNNAKTKFFLTPMTKEVGRPLDAIREHRDLDFVRLKAKQFAHHGGT